MEWVQHSSGPWQLKGPDYVCGGYNVPRWRVRGSHGEEIGELYAFNGADARRIVTCVNACEGIPTKALESSVVRELVQAAERALYALENGGPERLLDAVEIDARERLRTVLARVRGDA